MDFNVKRRLPGQGDGVNVEKAWGTDNPFLTFLTRHVNSLHLFAVIQFRNVIIDGIALAGWPKCPWLSRLVDRLTVIAEAMAEKSGVRA